MKSEELKKEIEEAEKLIGQNVEYKHFHGTYTSQFVVKSVEVYFRVAGTTSGSVDAIIREDGYCVAVLGEYKITPYKEVKVVNLLEVFLDSLKTGDILSFKTETPRYKDKRVFISYGDLYGLISLGSPLEAEGFLWKVVNGEWHSKENILEIFNTYNPARIGSMIK